MARLAVLASLLLLAQLLARAKYCSEGTGTIRQGSILDSMVIGSFVLIYSNGHPCSLGLQR